MSRLSRRQILVGAGSAALLAGCGRLPWQASQASKVPRVGYFSMHSLPYAEAFEQGLREHGYVQGKNIAVEYRFLASEGQFDNAASELVQLPVDVLVTSSTPGALAAKRATNTIPIVFMQTGDPVGAGLVASLARPGANLTGLSIMGAGLASKRLELLKETVPNLSRVAVLMNPTNANSARELGETIGAAQVLGLQLQVIEVRQPDEIESVFEAAVQEQAQATSILGDALLTTNLPRLAELAMKYRLPAMYTGRPFPAAGCLMAYGPNSTEQFRRGAYYVDRILKGTKPADLPVEQPMIFEFVVNMKTARALGITFPHEVALQITEVIE
jgi:putative ABC transport system substrate-binding protein